MIKNKLLSLSALLLLFLSVMFYHSFREEKLKQNNINNKVFSIGQSFEFKDTNLNPEIYSGPVWPVLSRPNTVFGYFIEYLRDRKTISKYNLGPLYFASKRVVVLEKLQKDSVIGNYHNFDQLMEWWNKRRPKSWQFWYSKKYDSWEAGLAEIYLNVEQEINLANLITDDTKRVVKFCELRRSLIIFNVKLFDKINNITDSEEQKNYLLFAKDEIFSRLTKNIASKIPVYNSSNYYFDVQFLANESEGVYEISFVNMGLSHGKAVFRLGKYFKSFNFGNEKIVPLGLVSFDKESSWAIVEPVDSTVSGQITTTIPVKIKLKKISSLVLEMPAGQIAENKKFNVIKYYQILSIILLMISIYLGNKTLKYKNKLIDIFNAICRFYRKRKKLSIFIYLGLISLILIFTVNYFDISLLVTILFWMVISREEKLGSRYSYFFSLGFLMFGPLLIISQKEITVEMVSITAFMFMVAGLIQQFTYLKKEPSGRVDIYKFYQKFRIKYLFALVLPVIILLIIKSVKGELAFYRYFFESNYLSEFIKRIIIKIFIFPVFLILFGTSKTFNKIFPVFIKNFVEKILLFSILSLALIMFVNKLIFLNERENFTLKPYITRINKSESLLEIYGHNFRDIPFTGKVYFNNTEVQVNDWKDWRITLDINSFKNNGELFITNIYEGYERTILNSNKIYFEN